MLLPAPILQVCTYMERAQALYHHLNKQPDSLIMRILGLYQFSYGFQTCYVLVSCNVLYLKRVSPSPPPSELNLEVFDLKGRVPKPVCGTLRTCTAEAVAFLWTCATRTVIEDIQWTEMRQQWHQPPKMHNPGGHWAPPIPMNNDCESSTLVRNSCAICDSVFSPFWSN